MSRRPRVRDPPGASFREPPHAARVSSRPRVWPVTPARRRTPPYAAHSRYSPTLTSATMFLVRVDTAVGWRRALLLLWMSCGAGFASAVGPDRPAGGPPSTTHAKGLPLANAAASCATPALQCSFVGGVAHSNRRVEAGPGRAGHPKTTNQPTRADHGTAGHGTTERRAGPGGPGRVGLGAHGQGCCSCSSVG